MNSMPSALAGCLASSVFPTPVGPVKRNTLWAWWARVARRAGELDASSISWWRRSAEHGGDRASPSRSRSCNLVRDETCRGRDLRHLSTTLSNLGHVAAPSLCRQKLGAAPRLVEQVDGFVGHFLSRR